MHHGETTESEASLAACAPCWMQVRWRIGERGKERARRAFQWSWNVLPLTIRLIDCSRTESVFEKNRKVAEAVVDPRVHCWFFEVPSAVRKYRAEIGYCTRDGRFHAIARSNEAASSRLETLDGGKIAALFSIGPGKRFRSRALERSNAGETNGAGMVERAQRTTARNSPKQGHAGSPMWRIDLKTEVVVYGQTSPGSVLEVESVPLRMNRDGRFFLRCELQEGRNVIPATVRTFDGSEERTVVLGIDRNTRILDPNQDDHDDSMI